VAGDGAPRGELDEAAELQLLTYARELNRVFRSEQTLTAELDETTRRLRAANLAAVRTLALVVGARDEAARAHLERTVDLALRLTDRIDPLLARDGSLGCAFLLHDIGEMAIPEAILRKPGPLTPDEWEVMRTHPEIGARILADMEFLGDAIEVVRSHHERWDGAGYPAGLAGEDIPLGARIFGVCDAFDAMTSDRPYRSALPFEHAVDEILAGSGSQFDPEVVKAFADLSLEPGLRLS
jgi:HD-GYP domain-containing protein (c-di-GMP phosphodiesterase class II)